MIAKSVRSPGAARRGSLLVAAGCAALFSACSEPAHQNPFDPASPPSLQARARLTGTVALEGLAPGSLAGTRVEVSGLGLSTTTGADGSFAIAQVPAGTWTLLASHAGFAQASAAGIAIALANGDQDVPVPALRLSRLTVAVSGRVTLDASGVPGFVPAADRSGIAVVLSAADAGDLAAPLVAVTTAAGDFVFPSVPYSVSGQSYALSAARAGYLAGTASVAVVPPSIPGPAALTLRARASAVRGCVFVPPAVAGGAPDSIGGVSAALSGTAFDGSGWGASGSVAADSANLCGVAGAAVFTFPAVPDGAYAVSLARSAYFAPGSPTVSVAGSDAQASPLVTRLVRANGAVGGTVAFLSPAFSPGVAGTFDVTRARSGAVVTLDGAELTGGHLVTTTDAAGQFFFPSVPANVAGHYTATVSQANFAASTPGSDAANVTVGASATASLGGLSLQVQAATVQVATLFRDRDGGTCSSPSIPMAVGACTVPTCPGDAAGAGVTVNVSGIAFTGDAISANPALASSAGLALFQLPPGSYTVSSAPAGRSADAAYPAAVAGRTACASLALRDRIAPTAPVIQTQTASPTSLATAQIALVQASSDATQPSSNFTGYLYRVCSPSCAPGTPGAAWSGAAPLSVPLVNGVDNDVEVWAADGAGNASASSFARVHRESQPPPQPVGVHVDNRDGTARITWDAVATNTSVPVAGYNVYYGPVLSQNYADYTGNFVSQGPSPIFVPGAGSTSLTLTGLSDANPFFVTVAAVDSVVSPAANVSPDANRPWGFKVNPNVAPLDRAVHLDPTGSWATPSELDAVAVIRDRLFVSQGTFVAGHACYSGTPTNVPPFAVREYQYDHYGQSGLTPMGGAPLVSQRARKLVADEDRWIYGYDIGGYQLARQPGLDVIDATVPGGAAIAQTIFDRAVDVRHPGPLSIDAIEPWHRADAGGAGATHGLLVYTDAANQRFLGTFAYAADHRTIAGCDLNAGGTACNALALSDQGAVHDVKVAGQAVLVLHDTTLESYRVADDFRSIALVSSQSLPSGWTGTDAALAVNAPRVYFSHVVGQGVATLFEATLSGATLGAPGQVATLHDAATHLFLAGGQLIATEDMQQSDAAVEVFDLANPDAPRLAGTYLTDDIAGNDIGNTAAISSAALYGTSLFLLEQDTQPSCYGHAIVDVVELGSLRSSRRLPELHVDGIAPQQIRLVGGRALGLFGSFTTELAQLDPGTLSSTPVARSATINAPGMQPVDQGRQFVAAPLAVSGDYAYVVSGSGATGNCTVAGCQQLAVYDVATPATLGGAGPVNAPADISITRPGAGGTPVTTETPVLQLVAANGYLYGAALSATDALLRWDVSNPRAPGLPTTVAAPSQAHGRSVDVSGAFVFVGTSSGFCVIDGFAMTERGCVTLPSGCGGGAAVEVDGIHADASRLYLATNFGPGSACGADDALQVWDTTPLAGGGMPALLQVVPQSGYVAANGLVKRFGPQLLSVQGDSSNFDALVGYDLLGALHLQNTVNVSASSALVFDAQGSLALVPDYPTGLVPVRLY